MTNDKTIPETIIYDDALTLLRRINAEIKNPERLSTLNSQMTGVMRNLSDDRIENITGKTVEQK